MSADGLVIMKENINELSRADILAGNTKEYWHKFVVENGGIFDKDDVLRAVLVSISPFSLVPVKFTVTGKDAYFLARNCGQVIEKLYRNSLPPIQLRDKREEVCLSVETYHILTEDFKVNMRFHLKKAIEKRCKECEKGYVDLSSFHKEPELYEILFCPLSTPRFLLYVLGILKQIASITSINLSNNEIENVKSLEVLREFNGLVSLDLSNNKIKDLSLAESIRKAVPGLQELVLDGNPICDHFKTELEYVNWIKDKNPCLKVLDGVAINHNIPSQKIWLCSEKVGFIANEFLKHYFTLYDSSRKSLENSYDENAFFSVSCDENFKDSWWDCHQNGKNGNQNIKLMGISNQGNKTIAELLCKFPLTQHDPCSFKVDVPNFQVHAIILFVCGLFKDFRETPRVWSFSRTFVLKKVASDEYKIANDLYHVTNATADEISNFCESPIENPRNPKLLVNKEEEKNLIKTVTRVTEMNFVYSRSCLEMCEWDVRRALEYFLEKYQSSDIPPVAFVD